MKFEKPMRVQPQKGGIYKSDIGEWMRCTGWVGGAAGAYRFESIPRGLSVLTTYVERRADGDYVIVRGDDGYCAILQGV